MQRSSYYELHFLVEDSHLIWRGCVNPEIEIAQEREKALHIMTNQKGKRGRET